MESNYLKLKEEAIASHKTDLKRCEEEKAKKEEHKKQTWSGFCDNFEKIILEMFGSSDINIFYSEYDSTSAYFDFVCDKSIKYYYNLEGGQLHAYKLCYRTNHVISGPSINIEGIKKYHGDKYKKMFLKWYGEVLSEEEWRHSCSKEENEPVKKLFEGGFHPWSRIHEPNRKQAS